MDWALDQDIRDHYVKDRGLFEDDFALGPENSLVRTEGKGTVKLPVLERSHISHIELEEVRHAPSATINLLSWRRLEAMGLEKLEDEEGNWMILRKDEEVPLFWCQKPSREPCRYQWIWLLKEVVATR